MPYSAPCFGEKYQAVTNNSLLYLEKAMQRGKSIQNGKDNSPLHFAAAFDQDILMDGGCKTES